MELPQGQLRYLHQLGQVLAWTDVMGYTPIAPDVFTERMNDHIAAEKFARATENESITNREVLAQFALTTAIDHLIEWRLKQGIQPCNIITVDFKNRRKA